MIENLRVHVIMEYTNVRHTASHFRDRNCRRRIEVCIVDIEPVHPFHILST